MGKAEVGTPKYLANKMKAKGLQKLRWYCQMCEKQCRDENGFKCHTMSESHQRQLLLFADSPGKFLYSFSKEFTDGYMELLRRRFGTKRINANKVYQEYIAAKDHIHMNATRWLTLSDFVKWLGRTGQVVADETEKGWYITYIDRSPEAMERQAKSERKEKMEKDDEERMREFIEKQIEKAAPATDSTDKQDIEAIEFKREDDQPLRLDIRLERKFKPETRPMPRSVFEDNTKKIKTEVHEVTSTTGSSSNNKSVDDKIFKRPHPVIKSEYATTSRTGSGGALCEIIEMEERKKDLNNRKDYWLHPDIVVRFVSKSLGDKYYKQKAVVLETIGKYSAKIQFISSGEKMKADQAHLETVIPSLDKSVMVVNGGYRGWEAILRKVNEHKGTATIEIVRGPYKGRIVKRIIFDDISKLNCSTN